MANWTQQDVEYLRRNPHLWKRFKDRFGSLPNDFQRPVPSDTDLQYLKNNPQQAEKFREAFGELPEEFGPQVTPSDINTQAFGIGQAPQDQGMQSEAQPDDIAPPDVDADLQSAIDIAPERWRNQRSSFVYQGRRTSPNLIDVPEEELSPELRPQSIFEEEDPDAPVSNRRAFNLLTGEEVPPEGQEVNWVGRDQRGQPDDYTGATPEAPTDGEDSRFGAARRTRGDTAEDAPVSNRRAFDLLTGKEDLPEGEKVNLLDPSEEGTWWEVMKGNIGSLPELFQTTLAGYQAQRATGKKLNDMEWLETLDYMAEREGKPLVNSSAVQAIAAEQGITEEDVIEQLYESMISNAKDEQEALQWHAELREKITEQILVTNEGSTKYYAGAVVQAIGFMGPSIATSLITRNPNMGLALIGTQVYGDIYGEQRNSGRSHEQASYDAAFGAAFEVLAERVPLGKIVGEGGDKLLERLLKAGGLEGMEEVITESLNIGYEMNVLDDDMTLGQAMVRLKDAYIIGAGAGAGLTLMAHPFVRGSSAPKEDLPPQLREIVSAHREMKALLERANDPNQKVSREQIEAAKNRYNRARKAGEEARENPEYAQAINDAANEVRKLEAMKLANPQKVKEAQDRLTTLIRGGPEAMAEMKKEEEQAAEERDKEPAKPAKEPAKAQRSASDEGKIDAAISQLSTVGANAPVPEKVKDQMIAEGLAKETPAGGLMVLPAGRRRVQEWRERRHENVINVGLDIGGEKDALSPERVRSAIEELGAGVAAEERQRSETENTMVVTLNRELTDKELDQLSRTLDQEAIAGRFGDKGKLEGPEKENWGGKFDPGEFREPEAQKPGTEAVEKPAKKPAKKAELDVGEALKLTDVSGMTDTELVKLNKSLNARGISIVDSLRKNLDRAKTDAEKARIGKRLEEAERVVGLVTKEIEARAKKRATKANPILRPEAVESLEAAPVPTAEDIQSLEAELSKSEDAFDLRTAELKALAGSDTNPAARQAAEAAIDARTAVREEARALERAEQENAAYARRERQQAKAERQKAREVEQAIKEQKEADADEAIALAEFLNKQDLEDSSPGALASALKGAYDSLSAREEKAMARLKDRMSKPIQGQLFDLGGALVEGSKTYRDLVEVGALKIAKGLVRFADWSAEMVDQFGKRVAPHLQGLYAASREAAKDAVTVAHRRYKSGSRKGQIVAAPQAAKTPQALGRLRNTQLKALAMEGAPGRFWYERSGKGILEAMGGNVKEARLFAGVLALYSAGTALAPNTTVALKVWNQWKAGEKIKGTTGAQDKKAEQWLRTGIEPKGLKVSNFYNNLMREIDPANYDVGQGATIDLWMMRAFGYERDVPTDAQYVLAQTEVKKLAKALGWEPQQAQAAIWVAIKARWEMIREAGRREAVRKGFAAMVPEGKNGNMILKPQGDAKQAAANQRKINNLFRKLALRVAEGEVKKAVQTTKSDYLDELAKHAAIVSWGSQPSTDIGQTMLEATFAEKLELQAEIEQIMINPDTGREWLAEWLGVIGNESFSGIGAWDMNIGATQQSMIMAPPGGVDSGPRPDVDTGSRRLLNAYSSMIGYLLQLDAVSWHRPSFTGRKSDANGVDADLGRQLSEGEVDRVYRAMYDMMRETFGLSHEQAIQYAPVPTPYGFRVMNFNEDKYVGSKVVPNFERKKDVPDFHDVATAAINEVFPLDDVKIDFFRAMGEVAHNDWAKRPNGESYVSRISQAKNPAVGETFERAKRELAPSIEAARREFAERVRARQRAGERDLSSPVSMDRVFAGGSGAVAEVYGRFGELAGEDTNAEQRVYNLDTLIKNPELVQAIADAYGFRIEYFSFESNPEAGVEFRLPQLKKKGYSDGYVWIYDPRNSHGSFKGAVDYTRAWRVSHEIAHGITESLMQAKYGDSKRYGRLGRELEVVRGTEGKQTVVKERALTLKEAQRAVEWEDVAFRAQRLILEQMGVKVTDAQFAQEYNINMADALYRVITGDFGDPGDFGFRPASKPADIKDVLSLLEGVEATLAAEQGREATDGVNERLPSVGGLTTDGTPRLENRWKPVEDAEIKRVVSRRRQNGMGQSIEGAGTPLAEPRVIVGVSGMPLPRKPRNAVRFRKFRPSETVKNGIKKLVIKKSDIKGEVATAGEFILDVPLSAMYNATSDPRGLRKNNTQAQFEKAIQDSGFAGFYQTDSQGAAKGSVSLFEDSLLTSMQRAINQSALERAAPPKTAAPKLSVDNPGGDWLAGKVKKAEEAGKNERGMPKEFGTVTASLRGTVLVPIDKAAEIPGMMGEQQNVRQNSLEWLKEAMGATGQLPLTESGREYAPFIQVDSNGNAWVNEGNHRIIAAKELGWTHIPMEVRWFNGGEQAGGKFSPDTLLSGHEAMAEKPRLPEGMTKVNKVLKRWARAPRGLAADRGAGLVMVPGSEGTVHLMTVRPARMISYMDLNAAIEEADRGNLKLTLSPESFGMARAASIIKSREWPTLREAGFKVDAEANQIVREVGQGSMFSVAHSTNHGKGLSLDEASGLAELMRATFPRTWAGADIFAVESWERLPAEIRRGVPDGFSKRDGVEAVFYDPGPLENAQIIIIANNNQSRGAALTAVIHEIVGHYGVRGVLGAGYQNYMDSVWTGFEKEAREAAKRNGLKDVDHKDSLKRQDARNKAAEEFIAYLAGEIVSGNKLPPAQIGFWEGILRAARLMLARYGLVDINARDIAHLINSAKNYARGGLFSRRQAFRKDVMLQRAVPEFYSQLLKHVEEKFPGAGTAEQYLGQIRAAQKKGSVKKEEMETVGIEQLLMNPPSLIEMPVDVWHKDDIKKLRAIAERAKGTETGVKFGQVLERWLQGEITSAMEGTVTEDGRFFSTVSGMQPSKLTKAGLLHLIGTQAPKVQWKLQRTRPVIADKRLELDGQPLISLQGYAVTPENAGRGKMPATVQGFVSNGKYLPPINPGARAARKAADKFGDAVLAKRNQMLMSSTSGRFPASSIAVKEFMENGTAAFYPKAAEAGLKGQEAEIYSAIRDLFIEKDKSAMSVKIAHNKHMRSNIDENPEVRDAVVSEVVFDGFLASLGYAPRLTDSALFELVARKDPSISSGDMSAVEFFSTRAQISGSPVEIIGEPEVIKNDSELKGLGSVIWPMYAKNTATGEITHQFMGSSDPTLAFSQIEKIHDWGDGVDPTSREEVSSRYSSYSLSTGLNAYQEWLLIDDNPVDRKYDTGHWHVPNAAHLRSGFVLDAETGQLVPIGLEVQSDTGQRWQKDSKSSLKGSIIEDIGSRGWRAVPTPPTNGIFRQLYNFSDGQIRDYRERLDAGGAATGLHGPMVEVESIRISIESALSDYVFFRERFDKLIQGAIDSGSPVGKIASGDGRGAMRDINEGIIQIEEILDPVNRKPKLTMGEATDTARDIVLSLIDDSVDPRASALPELIEALQSIRNGMFGMVKSRLTQSGVTVDDLRQDSEIITLMADGVGLTTSLRRFSSSLSDAVAEARTAARVATAHGELDNPYLQDVLGEAASKFALVDLRLKEDSIKLESVRRTIMEGGSAELAPSHATTTSHQLAAIKKLVAQAVEHGMSHVFFAPGEHSAAVAAMTTSTVEADQTAVAKIEFPFDGWADLVAFEIIGKENKDHPFYSIPSESQRIWGDLANYIIREMSSEDVARVRQYAAQGKPPAWMVSEIASEAGSGLGLMDSEDMKKALPMRRGSYIVIGHERRVHLPNGLTESRISSPIGIFPATPEGKLENENEVIGQIGYKGLRLIKEFDVSDRAIRLSDNSGEFRVNWTNSGLGFLENMPAEEDSRFATARGLRYAYNVILPTVVKKFAKPYKAKVSLRAASPAPTWKEGTEKWREQMRADSAASEAGDRWARAAAERDDREAMQSALRSWRQDGMPVEPTVDGAKIDYLPPQLMALEITDKMREDVRTTGFPMFSVKQDARADRVMGETMSGDGRKFRDFFADVTKGTRQQPRGLENYQPVIQTTPSLDAFAGIRAKYSGNFENHIMTSIPGYREAQDAIFVAITNTLGENGGTVLDIGASEGAALKAITQVNPNIKGVALDPNPEMKKTFDRKGGGKNVEYAHAAYGSAKEEGQSAWTEDDGTKIKFFDPAGQKFDVIYEGMVFQFISNERHAQLKRAKELMEPGGLLVIQEKLGGPKAQYDANEAKKDDYKALYYSQAELAAKKKEVLQTGGDAVEGMTDLQVSVAEAEKVLAGLFDNVVQIWDSGNFKGYAASDSAAKVKAFVDNLQPLRSSYETVATPRAVQSHGGTPMTMFSIHGGRTGNGLFDSFASKVGPFRAGRNLRDAWNAFKHRLRDRATVAMLDVFHGQKIAEEALGLNVDEMGYVSMRLAAGADAVVRSALEYGVPVWEGGATSIDETSKGFLEILAPLAGHSDKLRAWELWMVARRAARLKGEGRENLFETPEIQEVIAEVDRRGWAQEFESIAEEYAEWKSRLLDFAEEAGVINSETRPLWEHADHIPFYRVLEGDLTGPFSGGAIADVKQQIQRLRGSDKNIGDPLQNIFMNIASLIDASMRNHAARLSIQNLDGSGIITKHPQFQITDAAVPLDQLRARLRAAGVNAATMDAAGLRGIEVLTAIQPPTGDNVVSYLENGKRRYYEVHDPLVLVALQGVHPNPWAKMMALLRIPKRVFTQSITLDPIFMVRNWFRDMFHAFTLGRDGKVPVVPGYDSVRGAISSLRKDPKMVKMMSGGGAFDSGYVNANDPSGMAKIIRGRLNASGLVTNRVTGKVKSTFEFYRDLSSSIENSHRVMVFEKARKHGKSLKAASYEARDLMDFSMRGAHPIIRFLAETVPFWNARIQGVYRTFRVAGPGAARNAAMLQIGGMLVRGALLTLASVALFMKNRDDERWKELNDYEKNTYYHLFDVFEEGDHYALPKPFEIGAMFSTIPEIIAEGMLSQEPDGGKAAAKQFFHVITESLNFAPDIQAIMPVAELAMNRDTFRDAPILTDWDKRMMPEDQDHYRGSPAVRSLAHGMPDAAPDALRSPKQLSHLIRGYTGTLGAYAVGVADLIWWRLNEEESGLQPEKRPDEIVGVRSFVRNQPRKYPRSLSTLYDVLEDADKVYNSMRRAEREDTGDRALELEEDNIELIIAREAMDEARNEIRDINKEIREVHLDKEMRPEKKREIIDDLLKARNETAESVYEWRPGGRDNVRETERFKEMIEGSDFTGMTKKEQLDTLEELGLPRTADLVKTASLSPREIREMAGAS